MALPYNLTAAQQQFRIRCRTALKNKVEGWRTAGSVPNEFGGHGAAMHVQHGSKILFSEGYGRISPFRAGAYGRETLSGVRSCTKTMFAAVLMKAVERGQLSMSDTIGSFSIISNKFSTPMGGNGTLLDLSRTISQTMALIGGSYVTSAINSRLAVSQPTLDDCLNEYFLAGAQATPGTWAYSDVAIRLIGAILFQATGTPLKTLFAEMFSALGMTNTHHHMDSMPGVDYSGFYARGRTPPNNYADEVVFSGGAYAWQPAIVPETQYAISGVITTAVDHAKFWQRINTPGVWLSSGTLNTWLSAKTGVADGVPATSAPFINYGWGTYKFFANGLEGWGAHGYGGGGGHGGTSLYLRGDDFVVATTSNCGTLTGAVADDVAFTVINDWATNVR